VILACFDYINSISIMMIIINYMLFLTMNEVDFLHRWMTNINTHVITKTSKSMAGLALSKLLDFGRSLLASSTELAGLSNKTLRLMSAPPPFR